MMKWSNAVSPRSLVTDWSSTAPLVLTSDLVSRPSGHSRAGVSGGAAAVRGDHRDVRGHHRHGDGSGGVHCAFRGLPAARQPGTRSAERTPRMSAGLRKTNKPTLNRLKFNIQRI